VIAGATIKRLIDDWGRASRRCRIGEAADRSRAREEFGAPPISNSPGGG
jgi:hypothetical protein